MGTSKKSRTEKTCSINVNKKAFASAKITNAFKSDFLTLKNSQMETKLTNSIDNSNPIMKTCTFLYPLTQQAVRNCRIVNERLGDLIVTYTGKKVKGSNAQDPIDEQFKIDICSVTLNDQEIPPAILTYTELYQELEEAALNNMWWRETLDEDIPIENTPTYFTQKQSA